MRASSPNAQVLLAQVAREAGLFDRAEGPIPTFAVDITLRGCLGGSRGDVGGCGGDFCGG